MFEIHAGWATLAVVVIFAVAWLGSAVVSAIATREGRRDRSDARPATPQPSMPNPELPPTRDDLAKVLEVIQKVAAEVDRLKVDCGTMWHGLGRHGQQITAIHQGYVDLAKWVHSIPQRPVAPTPPIGSLIASHAPPAADVANHAAQIQAQHERLLAEEEKRLAAQPANYAG